MKNNDKNQKPVPQLTDIKPLDLRKVTGGSLPMAAGAARTCFCSRLAS